MLGGGGVTRGGGGVMLGRSGVILGRAEGHWSSTLEPKWLPVHGEAQHLQRRMEGPVRTLGFLPDDSVSGRDVLPTPDRVIPSRSTSSNRLIDYLQMRRRTKYY